MLIHTVTWTVFCVKNVYRRRQLAIRYDPRVQQVNDLVDVSVLMRFLNASLCGVGHQDRARVRVNP